MILFLTHADTEILGLRVMAEGLPEEFPRVRAANPALLGGVPPLEGAEVVIVRLLGGLRSWEPFEDLAAACRRRAIPLLCFGGEAVPDAECMSASTVPGGIVTQAFEYLVQGGTENLEQMMRFVADTVLRRGFGFEPPASVPVVGVFGDRRIDPDRPTVGIVFYRAHVLTGNTTFVSDLSAAIEARGCNALPVYCYSLRDAAVSGAGVAEVLATYQVDAVVTTVLAAGTFAPGDEGEETTGVSEGWYAQALGTLGVPVLQAIASMSSSGRWAESSAGLAPLDVAWQVALPELDGRIIGVPFSFKEIVDDGDELGAPVAAYRCVPDRVERVAGLACRLASLHLVAPSKRLLVIVLSAYPTSRSRLGNAVGLDTPASLIDLLHRLRTAGYRVDRIPEDGDALMAELADGLAYDSEVLPAAVAARALGTMPAAEYRQWFATLSADVQADLVQAWGEAPGNVHLTGHGDLAFSGIDLGGVVVAIQPPRGFGEAPIAIYHSPVLAPTHHYLGFYRWLDQSLGAHAVIHLGKHGTLEWLPGKSVGLSSSCYPDIALGDVPFIYPFVVNDPGEGAQAKRRSHAVVVDHLVPPLTRAESYDDIARLEQLLDEHAQVSLLDPSKLHAVRRQVWELLVNAEIHRDLGLDRRYGADGPKWEGQDFDDLVLEVDGYLCELKDAQIRGGLHILGRPPESEALVDLVLALTRLPQGAVPSLRAGVAEQLGIDVATAGRVEVDRLEAACRGLVERLAAEGWPPGAALTESEAASTPPPADRAAREHPGVAKTLAWVCDWLVPALRATTGEMDSVLGAADGRFVPPGPSGAPSRGMAHVLPTGRNFYSLDPKAVPSRIAMEVGEALAARLCERHVAESGELPRSVAIVVWGTAVMRTGGDDVAEALALLGVRPVWSSESGRVEGLEVVPLGELGRARVDVTLRVSGFFRDAFPHVIALVDDAIELVAGLDEPAELNYVKAAGSADPRIFGPAPGAYGSGILPVIESRNWQTDDDLAAVYLAWSGWSYGRGAMGAPAGPALARRLAGTEVAVKNQDNREHDIFDSDDYLQDHGGMVAAIRSLRGGVAPSAVFGDSSDPARPRVRSLAEEAARVVRSRVLNPKWIGAMQRHGYKGAFEMAATVDYLFGYDATAHVVEDWMYERVTSAYVGDAEVRKFFERSNPWALRAIAERLLEAVERGMWDASAAALETLRQAVLEGEGWEEDR
ncbi:MAG: cobaltochelatase subunit CobN [Acidimicrobiales bacterium]|jgi:cobaltochelatase CobN